MTFEEDFNYKHQTDVQFKNSLRIPSTVRPTSEKALMNKNDEENKENSMKS